MAPRSGDESAWNCFLESTGLGQYQQSSYWAGVKELEGWRCRRVLWRDGDRVTGGFQLLWRPYRRFWRIGYVSKGPVLETESEASAESAAEALKETARDLRLDALMAQPPDRSLLLSPALGRAGFLPNHLWGVIDANLEIDLNRPLEEIERDFRRTVRQGIRQAARRGVTIREGGREDLPTFFDLMAASCRRQKTRPNPAGVESFERLWDQFSPGNHVRLTFAKAAGELVAGLCCLRWGSDCTLWKKGWIDNQPRLHANELLYWDAIEWAHRQGASTCDFAALARATAQRILAGKEPGSDARRSRDFFNLGFGGQPVQLPPAVVHFSSRAVYSAYRLSLMAVGV